VFRLEGEGEFIFKSFSTKRMETILNHCFQSLKSCISTLECCTCCCVDVVKQAG
jgi:hypothetical protein